MLAHFRGLKLQAPLKKWGKVKYLYLLYNLIQIESQEHDNKANRSFFLVNGSIHEAHAHSNLCSRVTRLAGNPAQLRCKVTIQATVTFFMQLHYMERLLSILM